MKHAKKTKKSRAGSFLWIPVLLFLLMALIGAGAYGIRRIAGSGGRDDGLSYEDNAVIGAVSDGKAVIADLQAAADRGMITMSINASPSMKLSDPDAGVNWLIANPEEQSTKLIRVEVLLRDSGEKIYETGALRPGSYVTGTMPDAKLDVGIYDCVAYFYSYDIDTQEFLGKAGTEIRLYVQE